MNLPQVYARPLDGPADPVTFTDDLIFRHHKKGLFQLLVIIDEPSQLEATIEEAESVPDLFGDFILEGEATVLLNDLTASPSDLSGRNGWKVARVASGDEFAREGKLCGNRPAPAFYNPWRIRDKLRVGAKFVVVRADKFVFAACRDPGELGVALRSLPALLHCRPAKSVC